MKVEYRNLPHAGGKISTVGIVAGSLHEATPQEIKGIISYGMEHGINLIDKVMYDSSAAEPITQAPKGHTGGLNKTDDFKQYMSEYFKRSNKKVCKRLGVEFEHFLIDRSTMESYRYDEPNGQHELLKKLANRGWKVVLVEDGNLMAVEKDGHTITLEPGGQVEISLHVETTVGEIDSAYQDILGEIRQLLMKNQALASIGYHPKTKIDQLPLLPKSRYKMMYDYFMGTGIYGHNMMKGTASTQVSIDYSDEADFITKYRVANFLSPFIARLFDATPVFEGEIYPDNNCRILIWENTDPERTKLISGILDRTFNFSDYIDFLLRTPPILVRIDSKTIFTRNEKLSDLLERYDFQQSDYEHLISMVFPDVRVKNFLEIRMADALPYPYNMAVPALIKGIFYSPSTLDKYYSYSQTFSDEDIRSLNTRLVKETVFDYKNIEVTAFALGLLDDAISALDRDEASYLTLMRSLILKDGSMSNRLKALYKSRPDEFIAQITL
ncbi:MAG TPA: glutamate-cysteine ligase family protein [Desulfitobacteriaceae bacterium]|nr:glutamate-cysteine ligase family protein [Desulfitobacteriaceae bacterium]